MITIGLLSVSRKFCLQTLDELEEKLKYKAVDHKFLIEDVFDRKISQEIINKARSMGWKIHRIKPMSHGAAMEYLISICRSKYLVYWEDDVIPTMDIDLDACMKVMNAAPKVNAVAFNVYENPKHRHWFTAKEETFDGVTCTLADKFHFTPGMWRLKYVKKAFRDAPVEHLTHKLNKRLIDKLDIYDASEPHRSRNCVEHGIGCWFYGPIGHPPMTEHIGGGASAYKKEHKRK